MNRLNDTLAGDSGDDRYQISKSTERTPTNESLEFPSLTSLNPLNGTPAGDEPSFPAYLKSIEARNPPCQHI
ncbi:unnamed protein product [Linum trigynum]|uniref:Uncharacterized protein n=1 Tax=Linum trigynum TaxID=586398 RepID=A0AAV2F0R5_9ROSI